MMRVLSVFVLMLLLLSHARAQSDSSKHSAKRKPFYTELAKAPPRAAARSNPIESDPEAVAAGAKLYAMHCAECHGEMANGTRRAPSLRADQVQHATPGVLFWVLTNGVVRRGMPVWSKLPEPQRWQLVSYLKSLSSKGQ
jgi:mono/diheme cytochrome c family protein